MMTFVFFASWHLGLFLCCTFTCVLLHEFGHCLAAKRVGWEVRNIHLFPVGGVAQIDLKANEPKKELFVTACGPLVNLVLAPVFFLLAYLFYTPPLEPDMTIKQILAEQSWFALSATGLGVVNTTMLVFNLLPIFPMDGGRIFRASLALLWGNFVGATRVAVRVGQLGALLFAGFGMWQGIFVWPVIAVFLMLGAEAELSRTLAEHEGFTEV